MFDFFSSQGTGGTVSTFVQYNKNKGSVAFAAA